MTTEQNIRASRDARAADIAALIVRGLAGQRSRYSWLHEWSGREWRAVYAAAEQLEPLYREGLLPDELAARLGRSMLEPGRR